MIKKLIYFLLSIVLIIVLAVGALVIFVNPNDFKPLIVKETKKITGRDLIIDGNIGWSFWPNFGLSIENVSLSNPEGFAEKNLVQFDKAELSLAVLPTLSKTIEVNFIRLHGARFFMQTLADGTTNLDGLAASSKDNSTASSDTNSITSAEPQTLSPTPQNVSSWQIAVGEVDIQKASALIRDDQTDAVNEITDLTVLIGEFSLGAWVPVTFSASGKQNTLSFNLDGKTEFKLANIAEQSQLRELTLRGTVDDPSKNLDISALYLNADQLGLATKSLLVLNLKGKSQDLSFDSQSKLRLHIDEKIELIDISEISLSADLAGKNLPKETMKIALDGALKFDNKAQILDASNISLTADEIKVLGKANVALTEIPKVRFDFSSDEINLDAFLGATKTPTGQDIGKNETAEKPVTVPTEKAVLSDVEPDLSVLKDLDIAGTITIGKFIVNNVKVSDVVTDFAVNKGKAKLNKFDARLYEGTISATSELDATVSPAQFTVSKSMKNVQIQPLLIDAAEQKIMAGKGNIEIELKGVGLSPLRMRTGITGTVHTSLVDGAIYGINIPQIVREAKSVIKGEQTNANAEDRKTDFSAFTATFNLANGIASTTDMHLQSPAIRIKNQGSTNLLDESMTFRVSASVVETSKGQGAEDLDDLKGITIPIDIGGTWQNPSYGLDIKALLSSNKILEDKLREKAQEGLDKLLGDKAEDDPLKKIGNELLNNLLQ